MARAIMQCGMGHAPLRSALLFGVLSSVMLCRVANPSDYLDHCAQANHEPELALL